jgi:hypothetical protein
MRVGLRLGTLNWKSPWKSRILLAMNALLDEAISAIRKLPEAEQEAFAREVLERIEADARWDALLADPRSKGALARLAAEAQEDIERGDVLDIDPADRRTP